MEAHDIQATLRRVPALEITGFTTAEEAGAAFPRLMEFREGGIYVGRFSGQTPWEHHPNGDEMLHVLDGEVEITVLGDSEPAHLTLRAGSIFVVPRDAWHRQHARATGTLLSATPTPTDISLASDPRSTP